MVWSIAFAVLVSSSALMIMAAWVTGAASNPPLTVALMAVPALVMIGTGRGSGFRIGIVDGLFGLFVAAALVSTVINGLPPARDGALFMLSLLAYPAGRLAPKLSVRPFMIVTLVIVGIGTVAVGAALAGQWGDPHGKPIVFGFGHAATVFLTSFGFLLFAAVCFDGFQMVMIGLAAPALAMYAASQVRFTFLAIAGGLGVLYLVSGAHRRLGVAAVLGVVIASVAVGLAIRPHTSAIFLKYIISPAAAAERPQNPVAGECGELDNSVAIRKTLLRQAVQDLPAAGLFGHGLSSTAAASCFKTDPHNSVLQAILEFGWIGGALLVLLVATAIWRLWPAGSHEAAFVLSSLAYVALLDMAHGHLTSEGLLLLFTGYAASRS